MALLSQPNPTSIVIVPNFSRKWKSIIFPPEGFVKTLLPITTYLKGNIYFIGLLELYIFWVMMKTPLTLLLHVMMVEFRHTKLCGVCGVPFSNKFCIKIYSEWWKRLLWCYSCMWRWSSSGTEDYLGFVQSPLPTCSSKKSIQNDDEDFFCVTFVCEDGLVQAQPKLWESHNDISRMEEWK